MVSAVVSPLEERLSELGVKLDDLRSSEGWVRYLDVASRFHRYSFANQLLIAMQRPDATQVAGYRAWQGMGRQVLKGERGLKILAPMVRKDDAGDQRIFGFKPVAVFDVGQTDGQTLPERPEWPLATGTADERQYGMLRDQVHTATSVRIVEVDDGVGPSGARGWYERDIQRISLRASHDPNQRIATLLHELGHHFDPELETATRETKEHVAECVAYLFAPHFGIEKEACALSYLVGWECTSGDLLAVGKRIQKAYKLMEEVLGSMVGADDGVPA